MDVVINIGLYLTYVLLVASFVLALVFPILYMVKYPGEAKGTFIGICVLAVIFLLAYLLSSGDLYFKGIEGFGIGEQGIRLVGAGLITFYILGIAAVVAAIYSEIATAIK